MKELRIVLHKTLLTLAILVLSFGAHAQKNFFYTYTDSAKLVGDANSILTDFTSRVNTIHTIFVTQPLAVLNTKPFLIFYSSKSNKINLPIWRQVMAEQKTFFSELAGSKKEGESMFGYFFNGFYLPHEAGHALQHAAGKSEPNLYKNEYVANEIALLYWRKMGRMRELKHCYKLAKKIVRALPSPVPTGQDPVKYFNEHYEELGADPYKYGYYQFAQFVKIYEDRKLKEFDSFIKELLTKGNGQ
jgi:hypothetical protein